MPASPPCGSGPSEPDPRTPTAADQRGTRPKRKPTRTRSGRRTVASGGFVLEFDAARKIAQGLGAHLERADSVVEVKGETARLLPVAERTATCSPQGTNPRRCADPSKGSQAAEAKRRPGIWRRAEEAESSPSRDAAGRRDERAFAHPGHRSLDRVHQAMILFARGRSDALKRFLVEDGIGKDARFWKLAQSLSALYPRGTDEKRWVDGVLARKKGLGL